MEPLVDFLAESPMLKGILESYAQNLLSTIASDYKLDVEELSCYYKIDIPKMSAMEENAIGGKGESCTKSQDMIIQQSKTAEAPILRHNHLPVRWLVPGCEYCSMHGNIMCDKIGIDLPLPLRENPDGARFSIPKNEQET